MGQNFDSAHVASRRAGDTDTPRDLTQSPDIGTSDGTGLAGVHETVQELHIVQSLIEGTARMSPGHLQQELTTLGLIEGGKGIGRGIAMQFQQVQFQMNARIVKKEQIGLFHQVNGGGGCGLSDRRGIRFGAVRCG